MSEFSRKDQPESRASNEKRGMRPEEDLGEDYPGRRIRSRAATSELAAGEAAAGGALDAESEAWADARFSEGQESAPRAPAARGVLRERLAPGRPPEAASEQLLSPEADSLVASAFGDLATSVRGDATMSRPTVEDVVKDLLRPMLKAWLDENLPVVVEALVREEIERVSRRRKL